MRSYHYPLTGTKPYVQRVYYTDSRRVSAANFGETSAKHARNVRNTPRNVRETSAKHPRNTAKHLRNARETPAKRSNVVPLDELLSVLVPN